MPENEPLQHQIIAAGERTGLFVDHKSIKDRQPDGGKSANDLTEYIFFTMRPVAEYMRHFHPSWTDMRIKPVPVYECGDDGLGVAMVFETEFNLAMVAGDSAEDPMIVIEDTLERILDFSGSCPDEAAILFVIPFQWHMNLNGEIIYKPDEDEYPILDYDMFPSLEVHAEVIEYATEAEFDQAIATLNDDTGLGQAIQAMMQRLALFFRWLNTETPPRPPRLSRTFD